MTTERKIIWVPQGILLGYYCLVELATGEKAALSIQNFTTGLTVGLDDTGYRCRYCYETVEPALKDLLTWDGQGDPPGPWIKHKGVDRDGTVVDRLNPTLNDEETPP